ncbi:ABC transporter ATP-binding protein [Actinomyces vulturis]|uniref:ABC transporter ATP-binding protein n=1 Tax=Actinomyces vulturis TaxID=1857645 RepID=UPI000834CC6F|nr:ABC transporter ATP-binding protein [Actinomyces vulturis]
MSDEIAIEVRNVSKTFDVHADRRSSLKEMFVRGRAKQHSQFHALDDVSFTIKKGTTFGLIGHNGSGKSTMLKILAGVYRPSSGSVSVSSKVDALLELGAGFHGELTGRENIYLNGSILGRSKAEIDESLDWILDFAGIGHFIDEPVKVYSSGMTVRLGFAVAVAVQPSILIVDEIIAVGDEEFQRKCFDLMRELRERGTTIALVTHSLSLAQDICDEVVWLDHGKVRQIGPAHEVVSSYIAQVNAKENEQRVGRQLDNAESIDDDEFASNQGSGECRVTDIELFNSTGKPTAILKTGEKATIRLRIRSTVDIEDVEVGLAIVTTEGLTVAGPNSRHAGATINLRQGINLVDYELPNLILHPNHYKISTAVIRDGHTYDYSDRRFNLPVQADSVLDEPGLVDFPVGQWDVISSDEES